MKATRSQGRHGVTSGLHVCAAALVIAMSQAALASAQSSSSPDAGPDAEVRCDVRYSAPPCTDLLPEALELLSLQPVMLESEQGTQQVGSGAMPRAEEATVRWSRVVGQLLSFSAVQHGFRLTQGKTRRELRGPWFQDWFSSASSLFIEPTWSDGGKLFTNYAAHPMGGSVYAYIYRQNNSSDMRIVFGTDEGYFAHLAKASAVSALASINFELGPLSEASLGNVGLPPNRNKMAWVDIVVTPSLGAVWMAGEDALDRYVIERLERKIDNTTFKVLIRVFLNPTRSMAMVSAGEKPWKRPGRP